MHMDTIKKRKRGSIHPPSRPEGQNVPRDITESTRWMAEVNDELAKRHGIAEPSSGPVAEESASEPEIAEYIRSGKMLSRMIRRAKAGQDVQETLDLCSYYIEGTMAHFRGRSQGGTDAIQKLRQAKARLERMLGLK